MGPVLKRFATSQLVFWLLIGWCDRPFVNLRRNNMQYVIRCNCCDCFTQPQIPEPGSKTLWYGDISSVSLAGFLRNNERIGKSNLNQNAARANSYFARLSKGRGLLAFTRAPTGAEAEANAWQCTAIGLAFVKRFESHWHATSFCALFLCNTHGIAIL